MKKIGILFDMDGVIVDNTAYHMKAWEIFCKKHQLLFHKTTYYNRINGRIISSALAFLFDRALAIQEVEAYKLEKEDIYRALYQPHIKPVEGLLFFWSISKPMTFLRL